MENVKTIEIYLFHNIFNPKVNLELHKGIVRKDCTFAGFRWRIKGNQNPFPIYNGTWFVGLSPEVMKASLANAGYVFEKKISVGDI